MVRRLRGVAERVRMKGALVRLVPAVSVPIGVAIALTLVVSTVLGPAMTVVTARIVVNAAARTADAAARTTLAIVAFAVLLLARQVIDTAITLITNTLSRRIDHTLRDRMLGAALTPTGIAHLEDPALRDRLRAVQGLTSTPYTVGQGITGLAFVVRWRLDVLAQAYLVGRYFRWWAALVLVASGVLTKSMAMRWFLATLAAATGRVASLRRAEYHADLGLAPDAAKEIRVFGLQSWIRDRYRENWLESMRPVWLERRRESVRVLPAAFPGNVALLVVLGLVGVTAAYGRMSLGTLAVLVSAVQGAGGFSLSNFDYWILYGSESYKAAVAYERATRSAQVVPLVVHALPAGTPNDGIRFDGVSFRYPGRDRDALRGLDLDIPAGRSLAIVGPNGAGKTTLVKLLARLYEPQSGTILVDGLDVCGFDPAVWQRRIAAIFQDFVHYHLPARDNVAFGAIERIADEDALRRAAARAGILEAIESLPNGWTTVLSREYTDGGELSGGQWQRLALARALLAVDAGAKILVLDEPTANLDVRAEAELFERFLDLTQGLTTILISHRFSTVRHADRICVLHHGRIVEQGSHQELLDAGGRYARMFRLQAARFAEASQ